MAEPEEKEKEEESSLVGDMWRDAADGALTGGIAGGLGGAGIGGIAGYRQANQYNAAANAAGPTLGELRGLRFPPEKASVVGAGIGGMGGALAGGLVGAGMGGVSAILRHLLSSRK